MNIFEMDATYVAATYQRAPLHIVSGQGSTLVDEQGARYIDMGSGIAVNVFGVNDPHWKQAVIEQLGRVQHASNLYYTAPQAQLAKMLCEKTGMKKVFFGNSGAEANECIIKAARKYAADKYGPLARPTILTLEGSFHGRTITTLAATGQAAFHKDFAPFTPGFAHVRAGEIEAMARAAEEHAACGILLELVQGEGGVVALDPAYVQAVARLCARQDILLMIDEVQTGMGRTGALFACQRYGVMPDLLSAAKGLGGGLPIGAGLLGEKVAHTLGAGSHGSTFGGNPVCAAGALSVLSRIDEALLAAVEEKHALIVSALSGQPGIEEITGLGLMLGLKTRKPAPQFLAECLAKGVIVLTAKDKVRLLPALSITQAELHTALAVIKEVACA